MDRPKKGEEKLCNYDLFGKSTGKSKCKSTADSTVKISSDRIGCQSRATWNSIRALDIRRLLKNEEQVSRINIANTYRLRIRQERTEFFQVVSH